MIGAISPILTFSAGIALIALFCLSLLAVCRLPSAIFDVETYRYGGGVNYKIRIAYALYLLHSHAGSIRGRIPEIDKDEIWEEVIRDLDLDPDS